MTDVRRPYLMRPKTIAVTQVEGGAFQSFDSFNHDLRGREKTVHSILFEDGCVWDAVSGWRDSRVCTHCFGNGRIP